MSFSLYDLSDRELLFRLNDIADNRGLATSEELADALGIKGVIPRNVAIRLSWLKRFGAVNNRDTYRVSEETGQRYKVKAWYLTSAGERLIFGQLTAAQKRSLENIDSESLVETMAVLSGRYRDVNPLGRTLLARQWRAGTGIGRKKSR